MASPQTTFCTVRLLNIPSRFEFDDVRQLWSTADQSQILLWSLATSHLYSNKPSKTCTITFQHRSPDLTSVLADGFLRTNLRSDPEDSLISVEEKFHGLTPLNEIEDDARAINLVAVTGLGGKAFASWQYSDGSMWLRDFLPRDVPGLKVYIYGYPSTLYRSHSQAGLLEYTTLFVDELLNSSESFKDKPLILVGHSLGCLIIKKALTDYPSKVADIVYSVVFFGAPNQGLETSALLTLYTGEQTERLIRDLTPGSTILNHLHESFVATQGKLKVLTCFETQTTPTSMRAPDDPHGEPKRTGKEVMMVPKQSACLYTNNEERIPINLNHSMIAKLSSLPGSAYYTIARHLKSHVREIVQLQTGNGIVTAHSSLLKDAADEKVNKTKFYGQIPDCRLFIGRTEILTDISDCFCNARSKPSIVTIYGLGGAGKTQVASKFAQSRRDNYCSVIWIDSRSEREMNHGFMQLARAFLNEVTVDHLQDCVPPVLSWIEQLPHRWLLLFDNVDDSGVLKNFADRYVPKCGNGDIIITSRLRDSRELGYSIEITMLPEADAILMLLELVGRSGEEENAAAKAVVHALGYLPLAIAQAGAYIKNECVPTDRYLLHYRSQTQELELLGYTSKVSWPYRQSSATTWIVSFQTVERKNPAAAYWLALCCFLDRNISQDIFRLALSADDRDESAVNQQVAFPLWLREVCCKDGAWDELTFHRMTSEIHQYSLMRKSTSLNSPPSFQFHPIVQEVGKLRFSLELQRDFTSSAIHLIGRAIHKLRPEDDLVGYETSYLRQRSLRLHMDECYENAKRFFPSDLSFGTPWYFSAARQFARFYWYEGKWDIAEELQRCALSICSPDSTNFIGTVSELAATLRKRGTYQEAASLQQQAIDSAQSPEQKLRLMNELTSTYRDLGHLGDAIALQEIIVRDWRGLVGEKSRFYVNAQASLATLYYKGGRLAEAVEIEEMVLRRRIEDLGEYNLSTVSAMDNLATTYWQLERYGEAEVLEQSAVEIRLKLLGEEHLDTIRAKGHLSATFRKQGRFLEALALIQEVVVKKRKLFGKKNPSTIRSAKHLYKTFVAMHRDADAGVVRREYGLTI